MALDFLKNNRINWKIVLIENYKNIGLNENQFAIVNLITTLDDLNIKISSPQQLEKYMTISFTEIEHEMNNLIERNLLKVNLKNTDKTFNFEPLFFKLNLLFNFRHIEELINQDPYVLIENIFNQKLTNNQKSDLDHFINTDKNFVQDFLNLLIKKDISNLDNFIISLKKYEDNELPSITNYDWLRN